MDKAESGGGFLQNYRAYLSADTEHTIELFERIVGAVCSGSVTFGALYVTILHENRKK